MKKIAIGFILIFVLMTACNNEKQSLEKNKDSIHLVISMTIKPECRNEVMTALETMITETRKEKGCIAYFLMEKENSPNDFILIEEWASQEDLTNHGASAHFAAYKKAMDGKLESSSAQRGKLVY